MANRVSKSYLVKNNILVTSETLCFFSEVEIPIVQNAEVHKPKLTKNTKLKVVLYHADKKENSLVKVCHTISRLHPQCWKEKNAIKIVGKVVT